MATLRIDPLGRPQARRPASSRHRPRAFARLAALVIVVCGFASAPPAAGAGSIDRLNVFMTSTQSARGEFEQRIVARDGRVIQTSKGALAFQRPGKFRWTYAKPYPQVIVGDGEKVWVYDEDLKQVTVRKLDAALGATPAALLAGSNDVLAAFDLKDLGSRDGRDWVEAVPKTKEGSFERFRMGFGASGLEAMELTDTFGQTTLLRFVGLERNPTLEPGLFRFTPPEGADVIGDR